MKRARKGFTLVELLIVVAILATLAAAMTVSVMGSTAKAKAATIASNVEEFVKAAELFCADNVDTDISSIKTDAVIESHIGKWKDLQSGTSVKYTANDLTKTSTATQADTWCVKVEIVDKDKTNIIAELEKIPGFGKYGVIIANSAVSSGTFYVHLSTGKVSSGVPTI